MQIGFLLKDEASETEQTSAAESAMPVQQPKVESKATSAKKKKKAKQKQKKADSTAAPGALKPGGKQHQTASRPEDDIDQLLASLNITQTAAPEASTSGRSTVPAKGTATVLLGVNPAKLKADDEMRRIFGSRVVDAEARSEQAGGMVGGSRRVRR